MKKVLKDLSALKLVLPEPVADKTPEPTPISRASGRAKRILQECHSPRDLFSRMLGDEHPKASRSPATSAASSLPVEKTGEPSPTGDSASAKKLAALRMQYQALRKQCAALEARLNAKPSRNAAEDPRLAAWKQANARLTETLGQRETEITRLKTALAQATRPMGLLNPGRQPEMFEGELAEHVREALEDAQKTAEQAGRQRRAVLLAGLLATNPKTGILQEKRRQLTALFSNYDRLGEKEIAGMEALGFRFISGKKHHKFKMGDSYVTISKTPSDHRSTANLLNEIKSRFF